MCTSTIYDHEFNPIEIDDKLDIVYTGKDGKEVILLSGVEIKKDIYNSIHCEEINNTHGVSSGYMIILGVKK